MSFNPHPSKQAKEIIFSRKDKNIYHPSIYFSDAVVNQTKKLKHLELILDHNISHHNSMIS